MIRLALFSLILVTALHAQTEPEAKPEEECASCTARHTALKKLQEARAPEPESAEISDEVDENNLQDE